MNIHIYKITHKDSGRVYVGQTYRPRTRWRQHMAAAERMTPIQSEIGRAIREHGLASSSSKSSKRPPHMNSASRVKSTGLRNSKNWGRASTTRDRAAMALSHTNIARGSQPRCVGKSTPPST